MFTNCSGFQFSCARRFRNSGYHGKRKALKTKRSSLAPCPTPHPSPRAHEMPKGGQGQMTESYNAHADAGVQIKKNSKTSKTTTTEALQGVVVPLSRVVRHDHSPSLFSSLNHSRGLVVCGSKSPSRSALQTRMMRRWRRRIFRA